MLGGRFRWTAGVIALSCVPGTEARGDVRSFAAVADTYVSSAAPAKNFGRSATLEIARRPTERAYLRFNVTLPTDAAISGATLTVVTRAARGTAVYRAFAVSKDRKSTRLNSSHANISYAVFCLKKKKSTFYQGPTTVNPAELLKA